jgi:hypothetical protein
MESPEGVKLEKDRSRTMLTPGDIEVFQHDDFNTNGEDGEGWRFRTALDVGYIGDEWNDDASSVIIYSGIWDLYADAGFRGQSIRLGPGYHTSLDAAGLGNDVLSSFRQVS